MEIERGCSSERLSKGKEHCLDCLIAISEPAFSGIFVCLNLIINNSEQLFLHPRKTVSSFDSIKQKGVCFYE